MGTIKDHLDEPQGTMLNPWTGSGWTKLIYDCHDELVFIDPEYKILQIKEKFGGLRYYFEPSQKDKWETMNKVITKYEKLSYLTCEACGEPGSLSKSGGYWMKTTCPVCAIGIHD